MAVGGSRSIAVLGDRRADKLLFAVKTKDLLALGHSVHNIVCYSRALDR
jgi:hypothetical protein